MNEQPQQGAEIYKAMAQIMAEIGSVSKDRKNSAQNYQFRGIDDFLNAVNPPMVKAGVFCLPTVTHRDICERTTKSGAAMLYTVLTVQYRFVAKDGSFVECTTVGEAADSGDKSTNKAMSAAQKYALIQVFCIPTNDPDQDSEVHTHEFAPRQHQPPRRPAPQQPAPQAHPMKAESEAPAALAPSRKEVVAVMTTRGFQPTEMSLALSAWLAAHQVAKYDDASPDLKLELLSHIQAGKLDKYKLGLKSGAEVEQGVGAQ